MTLLGHKIAQLQDSNFRTEDNNNGETSIYINRDIANGIGIGENTAEFRLILHKEDFSKAIAFIYNFDGNLFYKRRNWQPSFDWMQKQIKAISLFFGNSSTYNYDVETVIQRGGRYYFKNLSKNTIVDDENVIFTLRDFIIQDHTDIQFHNDENDEVHLRLLFNNNIINEEDPAMELDVDNNDTQSFTVLRRNNYPHNWIFFGAPGTGKSHSLKKLADELHESNQERVTFYPTYTYQQFVGTYKPETQNDNITYDFVEGPLLRLLTQAYHNPDKDYLLIIEEINRANAAAVFGDTFQLLDRDGTEKSQFPIALSKDIKKYLEKNELDYNSLFLPPNFYIWATMNSADQGVFPLDTAFKRRWNFNYLDINEKAREVEQFNFSIAGRVYKWNEIRRKINSWLLGENINEDKLLGPFFLSMATLNTGNNPVPDEEDQARGGNGAQTVFTEAFKSKVLMYLFEDAIRHNPKKIFKTETQDGKAVLSYSIVCEHLRSGGLDAVFVNRIEPTEEAPFPAPAAEIAQQQEGVDHHEGAAQQQEGGQM